MLTRDLRAGGAGAALFVAGLIATFWPLPPDALEMGPAASTFWLDRHGRRLAERPSLAETRAEPVEVAQVSPHLVLAVLAVEDKRFYAHPGVDPLATARALRQNLAELRVVSGGSTLTQQLARLLYGEHAALAGRAAPARTPLQKLREALLALRLEASFDKTQILRAFLNRAPFGRQVVGVEAAAQHYFGKSAGALSLAQAAYLAGLPKGPSFYDPERRPERATARQAEVLAAMLGRGIITPGQHARARSEPVTLVPERRAAAAGHAVELAKSELAAHGILALGKVQLTLDAALQADVEAIVAAEIPRVYRRGARSAAAVVIDNASGDILALVGAAFAGNPLWGQFNAATAKRQPGSALKPFIYASAMARGMTAASLAGDIDQPFPDTWGIYSPENFDGRYYGPVRLREALAQSLNTAAVDVLYRSGLTPAFTLLDKLGLKTLERRPTYYGLGLTLGSGGVRLVDLTNAYAALARGGVAKPYRLVASVEQGGGRRELAVAQGEQVINTRIAYIVADILADTQARIPQFGDHSVLAAPYWLAAKTGTSKGFRDNWVLGFSDRVTVGVWVGDPSGQPMRTLSGVEGAGPIWRKIMNRVTLGQSARPKPPEGIERVRVCGTSGARLGPHCPGGRDELFVAGTAPQHTCAFHRHALIDPANGLLVPEGCLLAGARRQVVTVYPSPYDAWALANEAGLSERTTPRCARAAPVSASVALLSPAPRETLRLDADVPRERQALPLQAVVESAGDSVTFLVDGTPLVTVEAPHVAFWPLALGTHAFTARTGSGVESAVHYVHVY